MVKMEETVTTEERVNPDGSKTTVTKTVRKTPAQFNGGTNTQSRDPGNADGSPRDGGTESGDPWGKGFCCVPVLCTIM